MDWLKRNLKAAKNAVFGVRSPPLPLQILVSTTSPRHHP